MDKPTPEVERTRVTPGIPLSAVSMGKVTSCSTSSGAMPPASVSTVTNGLLRSGNTSTGVRHAVMPPYTNSNAAKASTKSRLCRLNLTIQLNMPASSANLRDQRRTLDHHAVVRSKALGDQHG